MCVSVFFFCDSTTDFVARKFQLFEAIQRRIFFEQTRQPLSSELSKRLILQHAALVTGLMNISWYYFYNI